MNHNQFAAGPASPSSKKRSLKEMSQVSEDFERMSIDGTQKRRKVSDAQPSARVKFAEPIEPIEQSGKAKLTKQKGCAKENLANGPEEKQESPKPETFKNFSKRV